MRYRVTKEAEQDLDEIYVYWARRASPETADRLIDSIVDRFWLLREHPDTGRLSEDIAAGVKCFPAGKYLIYYRATRRGTDILHVFQRRSGSGASFQSDEKAGLRLLAAHPSAKNAERVGHPLVKGWASPLAPCFHSILPTETYSGLPQIKA